LIKYLTKQKQKS